MQVKKQKLELDMEQQTGSKSGREYVKAVYYHSAYLTYMQNTSCKIPGWMKHSLESRSPGEISITSDMQMTPQKAESKVEKAIAESKEELKSLLMKVKKHSQKAGLKLNIQKTKIMAFGSITSCQIDREKVQTVTDFIFFGLRNYCGW